MTDKTWDEWLDMLVEPYKSSAKAFTARYGVGHLYKFNLRYAIGDLLWHKCLLPTKCDEWGKVFDLPDLYIKNTLSYKKYLK